MEINDGRKIGDKVSVNHEKYPGVWIIKSRGPANSTLEREDDGSRLRVPHWMLIDPTAAAPPSGVPDTFYNPGELVRVVGGRFAGLYVVIADKRGDKVNLAKLGGEGGRYLRASRRGLEKVAPEDVIKPGAN